MEILHEIHVLLSLSAGSEIIKDALQAKLQRKMFNPNRKKHKIAAAFSENLCPGKCIDYSFQFNYVNVLENRVCLPVNAPFAIFVAFLSLS